MNATNRAVNRLILGVVGLVLIAVGGGIVTAIAWPAAADMWREAMSNALGWLQEAHAATKIAEATTLSWLALAVLIVLALIVAIAVTVMARLGGGRTTAVTRVEAGEGAIGAVTIRHGFAADALTHSLAGYDELLTSRVNASRVRGEEVLHVSVTPRQNTSPAAVAGIVTQLVDNLAVLLGRETPTYVSIHSGVRARLAADQSRVK